MSSNALIESLIQQREDFAPTSILALFDALADVYFFMKDAEGRFIGGNRLQLDKLGLRTEAELIGKADTDFFPSYMVDQYAKDDRRVIETGEPVLRRVELVANVDGTVSWHVTSKFPLCRRDGERVGIIGYMRDFDRSQHVWQPYQEMNAVVEYIDQHFAEAIGVGDLAREAGLSISQFERRFGSVFHQTPSRFLIRYRLTRATQMLVYSNDTLAQIAYAAGFYDHSHFSREFKKHFGTSPGQYRKEHKDGASSAM